MRIIRYLIPVCILAGLSLWLFWPHRSSVPDAVGIGAMKTPETDLRQAYVLPLVGPAYLPMMDTAVPKPNLDARAALAYDIESDKVLYSVNPSVQMPIASVTKLMSAMVAWDLFGPDELVTVASVSVRVDGSKQTLYAGERLRVRDLVTLMLVESSNDAAYALAQHADMRGWDFIGAMNARAADIGMRDTHFKDPAGLDDTALSTAHDVMRMIRAALAYGDFWPIMRQRTVTVTTIEGTLPRAIESTNQLLDELPDIVGGKTGYTDGALGCLALVVHLGQQHDTIITVILGSRARFEDSRRLIRWLDSAYRWY